MVPNRNEGGFPLIPTSTCCLLFFTFFFSFLLEWLTIFHQYAISLSLCFIWWEANFPFLLYTLILLIYFYSCISYHSHLFWLQLSFLLVAKILYCPFISTAKSEIHPSHVIYTKWTHIPREKEMHEVKILLGWKSSSK